MWNIDDYNQPHMFGDRKLQLKAEFFVFEHTLAAQHVFVLTEHPDVTWHVCETPPTALSAHCNPHPAALPFSSVFWQQRSPASQSPNSALVPIVLQTWQVMINTNTQQWSLGARQHARAPACLPLMPLIQALTSALQTLRYEKVLQLDAS